MLGHTPIKLDYLLLCLQNYSNYIDANVLSNGFRSGFKLQYMGPRLPRNSANLQSALQHPEVVHEKLVSEVKAGRMLGPFKTKPISNLQISPIGIVPKKTGGWRLIMHLSHPENNSINDFIDPLLTSVSYTTFDQAMKTVQQCGPGALLGKKDIKSAFRLLPVHPGDFDLLGIEFQGNYYIDKCLPMGSSISCATFEKFASFLEWEVRRRANIKSIEHYLDDFLFCGPKESGICQKAMLVFEEVCSEFGIPVAVEKTEGPCTCLVFLGLEVDTVEQVVRVPMDKIRDITVALLDILTKSKIKRKELEKLLGSLAFCARAMPGARAFSSRLYALLSSVKSSHHFIRLSLNVKEDLKVWVQFFKRFNGSCHFLVENWISNADIELFTDSAGGSSLGCAAVFGKHWSVLRWPKQWAQSGVLRDVTFLELVPIVLALSIWCKQFENYKLLFRSDNAALVEILNKKSSKSLRVMQLIRPLVLFTLEHNIHFRALHIKGVDNKCADSLSRFQFSRFHELAPFADKHPVPIPAVFWEYFKIHLIH